MKKLLKYFGNGLLFLVPIGVTVYVVYWVFTSIDNGVSRVLGDEEGKLATGLGVLITLAVITGVGVLTRLFITRPLLQLIEKLFGRLPLIKLLYSSIKDLIGAFVGDKKRFDQPALVSLSAGGAKTLGFITRKSLDFWDMPDDVAVYLPQSYNFAGNMLIVPQSQVTLLDADSSEVMAFLVSGGISGPKTTVKDNKEKK